MLNPAAAEAQLYKFMVPREDDYSNPAGRFKNAIKKLPKKLQPAGLMLAGLFKEAIRNPDRHQDFVSLSAAEFFKLSRTDRTKILKIFFGSFAAYIELTEQWLISQPYQEIGQNGFRAIDVPELSQLNRYQFLRRTVQLASYLKDGTLDPVWLATWAAHLKVGYQRFDDVVGVCCAAIIDRGKKKDSDAVFDILSQSLTNDHEIGAMGRHIPIAFFRAEREAGWELMEKTLLAAQRQEGLRQVILESARTGNPQAIARLLSLIIDKKLLRFSSVVQALDQWFGLEWSSLAAKKLEQAAKTAVAVLHDSKLRKKILKGDDAEAIYYALWSQATEDATKSVATAKTLLKSKHVETRYVAALHLSNLPDSLAAELRLQAIYDEDIRVAVVALFGRHVDSYYSTAFTAPDLFEALEHLVNRIGSKQQLDEIVWPWTAISLDRKRVAEQMPDSIGDRHVTRLVPYMPYLDSWKRASVVKSFSKLKEWDQTVRDHILDFVGDRSSEVSTAAVKILKRRKLQVNEAPRLEDYLTRTGAELRKNLINLLMTLSDEQILNSSERLLNATKQQRLGGLELLRQLCENDRSKIKAIQLAATWSESKKKLLKAEQIQIDAILDSDAEVVSLENGLGLLEQALCTQTVAPKKRKALPFTKTVPKLLKSLDDLVHKHREDSVTYQSWGGEATELLGNIQWGFPTPNKHLSRAKEKKRLPLFDLWHQWCDRRPKSLTDKDGLELLRAQLYLDSFDYQGRPDQLRKWSERDKGYLPLCKYFGYDQPFKALRYERIVGAVLDWLVFLNPPTAEANFFLDVYETALALLPSTSQDKLSKPVPEEIDYYGSERNKIVDWRHLGALSFWRVQNRVTLPELNATQLKRAWQLEHWRDRPTPGANRDRPVLSLLAFAYNRGFANIVDVTDDLIGPRRQGRYGSDFGSLRSVTQRRTDKDLKPFVKAAEVAELIDGIRDRILDVELARGEAATAASDAALAVSAYQGTDVLLRLLSALGKDGFKKLRSYNASTRDSKAATLTEMVSNTFPLPDDSHEDFTHKVRAAVDQRDFPEERLLQLAFLAPQWIPFVESAIAWDGFGEGILWYMAHMGHIWQITRAFEAEEDEAEAAEALVNVDEDDDDDTPRVRPEKLSRFERMIRERTGLSREEREAGAIDVPWFHRTYELLTPDRFEALAAAAKFATTPQSAKKAQYVADVLLGKILKSDIVQAIQKKNLKEKVRLLGLLPLDRVKTQDDILDRYEVLQAYLRYAKKLSSMSRPDAIRSYEIGMHNLASTAGFVDPIRLQWTLEAASTKDLAAGPIVIEKNDISLTLELDQDAKPFLTIRRGEKELKSLPKSVNKDPAFVDLRERNKHLKRQVSRVKQSLEQAMLKQDTFTGSELVQLSDHALLWPQLSRLVLVGEGIMGFPVKRGKGLIDHRGKIEPIKKKETLRIAHPTIF